MPIPAGANSRPYIPRSDRRLGTPPHQSGFGETAKPAFSRAEKRSSSVLAMGARADAHRGWGADGGEIHDPEKTIEKAQKFFLVNIPLQPIPAPMSDQKR